MTIELENAEIEQEVIESQASPEASEANQETEAQSESAAENKSEFVATDDEKIQARFKQMTAEKYAERNKALEEKNRADKLQEQLDATQDSKLKEPTEEDFDFDSERFQEATIKYRVELQRQEDRKVNKQQALQAETDRESQQLLADYNTKVDEFVKDHTDYDRVMSQLPKFPPATYEMLLKSGVETVYNIASNLDAAYEIANLSTVDAALRIGQLSQSTPAKINLSSAPEPINTIKSGGESPADEWDEVAKGSTIA